MKCIQGSKRRQVRCYVKGGEAISKTAAIVNRAYSHNYRKFAADQARKQLRHNGLTPLSLLKSSMFEMCVQSEANQKRLDLEQEYSDR